MKKFTVFPVTAIMVLYLISAAAYAQSLGDLAREEQKRRDSIYVDEAITLEVASPIAESDEETSSGVVTNAVQAQSPTRSTTVGNALSDVKFEIADNPVKGDASSGLILVEFIDYECPFCSRYVRETLPQILRQYVDNGVIQYAVIDFPLSIHPRAAKAAEASHCAGEQGKFWEIHDLMMAKQKSLGDLSSFAVSLNLNISKFNNCVNSGKYASMVSRNIALAQKLGINSAPNFIIGRVNSSRSRKVTGISMIRGAVPFTRFQMELNAALSMR